MKTKLILFLAVIGTSAHALEVGPARFEGWISGGTISGAFDPNVGSPFARVEEDRVYLRHARLGVRARLPDKWNLRAEWSHDDGVGRWRDVHLSRGFDGMTFTVGQLREPFGISVLTAVRRVTELERAAFIGAFGLGRRHGVALERHGPAGGWKVGAFWADDFEVNYALPTGPQDPLTRALAGRVYLQPVNTDETLIQIGASMRMRDAEDGGFAYRARPAIRFGPSVNGTPVLSDRDTLVGLEALYNQGGLMLAGEITRLENDGFVIPGGYVRANWFVTPGDKISVRAGVPGAPELARPFGEGGWGGLALYGRFEWLDLSDAPAAPGRLAEAQTAVQVGLTWHGSDKINLSLEYSDAELSSSAMPNAQIDAKSLQTRLRLVY
jgi:phosphate-selective porin